MKEETARWMLRIMHHFSGQARETLLSLLEQSLDDLEKTVKSEMHAEVTAVLTSRGFLPSISAKALSRHCSNDYSSV
jgi:hypothetical protein